MTIQTLQKNQLALFFNAVIKENWDPQKAHIYALLETYPNDFFIAYHKSKLIGFISAIKHSEEFGDISSFLILKEFRKLGYGKKLFNHALRHLGSRQIALDSVVNQVSFYKNFGFTPYFEVPSYKFIVGSITLPSLKLATLNFDKNIASLSNSAYINSIITQDSVTYKAIGDKGSISAYALSAPYKDGYKIHIESTNIYEALTLFSSLTNMFKKETSVYLEASKLTPILMELIKELKMKESSKFIRMYNKILN